MPNNKPKRTFVKDSSKGSSPRLLQALKKLHSNGGGSVSYVFVTERFERKNFINKKGEKDFFLEPVQIKSTLHCSVGPEALISNNPKVKPGTPKTLEELIEMFHSIKWDLGADYFIVDQYESTLLYSH